MTSDSPFAPAYSRQTFLETLQGGDVLRRLDDGLGAREPFLLVTGGPGVGKTALAYEAVARWGSRVTAAFLAYTALEGAEFLEEIVRRFGGEPPDGASRSKLLACLERALADNTSPGQVAMLVVDDAHDLSPELLEELRLLVNAAQQIRRPLEVLLIGLPTLEARLDEPALVALRQRVSVHAKLEPLSAAETQRYLNHRITAVGGDGPSLFSRTTCRDIAARTRGVPRQVNALAAEALRVARARGDQTVGSEHVQTAAETLGGFVPTGDVEDSAEADSDDSPAPGHSATPATPKPTTPASHDPREWVARFVGDKGPVQISSRALPESIWAVEPSEASGAEPSPTETPPALRDRPDRASPRSRSRHRGGLRVATTALLAATVAVTAVALVIRAVGLARSRAGQVAGAMTTATAPQDANSSTVAPSPPARVDEHRSGGSTARSRRPYTLDVGGYDDLESALDQRDRIQALTGIEGWVAAASDGGGKAYRIVLGAYRSHARATAAADMLLNSKTLSGVTVVPLPPRSERR